MLTFDEAGAMLDDIAEDLPEEFYGQLNGGIILLPETKLHPESIHPESLYILGEYHHDPAGLGRYIAIYYGSFIKLYGHAAPDQQRERLKEVLIHEFTHHLESLAGEYGLEITDALKMQIYRQRK